MKWSDIFHFKNKTKENLESKSERATEIQEKLLEDRIIFLGTPIDDVVANEVIAKMLYLEYKSPNKDINLYINSLGGSITSSFAIYDTIKSINPDVATVCVGQAAGTGAILLAGGKQGKRFAQPSSRIVIYKPKIPSNNEQDPKTVQKEL